MLSYHPQQLPGGPGRFDSIGVETETTESHAYADSLHDPIWTLSSTDAHLGSVMQYTDLTYDCEKTLNMSYTKSPRFLTAYDRGAHGFGLVNQQQHHEDHLYRLGLDTAWHESGSGYGYAYQEDHRGRRYVSPTDGSISSSSSSSSAFSDFACGADAVTRVPFATPFAAADVWPSPISEFGHDAFGTVYPHQRQHQHQLRRGMMASPVMVSPTACSMRDVQYTPDADVDMNVNAAMDADPEAEDAFKIKVQSPKESNLTEKTSPHDSGLGRSVGDATSGAVSVEGGDEVDYDAEFVEGDPEDASTTPQSESDNDSDFTPRRRGGSVVLAAGLRTSMRTARRTASKPVAVLDEYTRVHKLSKKPKTKGKVARGRAVAATSNSSSSRPSAKPLKSSPKADYPCPFHNHGCPASFPSKNEWKRHTLSQHLQLDYYRCDLGVCSEHHESGLTRSRGWNDFGRKDLFVQHVRRMHRVDIEKEFHVMGRKNVTKEVGKEEFERWIDVVRQRCWRHRRDGPGWLRCGVEGCGEEFGSRDYDDEEEERAEGNGPGRVWEDRVEHMARHYEREGVTADGERVDVGLREWAVREGIVDAGSGVLVGLLVPEGVDEEVKGGHAVRRSRRNREEVVNHDVHADIEERSEVEMDKEIDEVDDTDAEGEDDE